MKPSPSPRRRGFTLAELMVVVVILGLLATLVVKNVFPALFKAKVEIAKAEIQGICGAIELYQVANGGRLPETLEPLITPDDNGVTFLKNMTTLPQDPWGFPYLYERDPNGMTCEVKTLGRDGEVGGEGDNKDISNKSIANERSEEKAR